MKDDQTPSSKVAESVSANSPLYFSHLDSVMPTGHTFITGTGCRAGKTASPAIIKAFLQGEGQ